MRFIFVRHGHTYFNEIGLTQGWCDSPLSKLGVEQVNRLKKQLEDTAIDAIYASVTGRTQETAEILNEDRQLPIILDKRLKEINFGYFEGLPEKLRDQFQVDSGPWQKDLNMDYSEFGGEKLSHVIDRQKDLLSELIQNNNNQTIMIIGHGCSLYGLVKTITDTQIEQKYPKFKFMSNAGAVIIEYENNEFTITNLVNM